MSFMSRKPLDTVDVLACRSCCLDERKKRGFRARSLSFFGQFSVIFAYHKQGEKIMQVLEPNLAYPLDKTNFLRYNGTKPIKNRKGTKK